MVKTRVKTFPFHIRIPGVDVWVSLWLPLAAFSSQSCCNGSSNRVPDTQAETLGWISGSQPFPGLGQDAASTRAGMFSWHVLLVCFSHSPSHSVCLCAHLLPLNHSNNHGSSKAGCNNTHSDYSHKDGTNDPPPANELKISWLSSRLPLPHLSKSREKESTPKFFVRVNEVEPESKPNKSFFKESLLPSFVRILFWNLGACSIIGSCYYRELEKLFHCAI